MGETKLFEDCKDVYKQLSDISWAKVDIGYKETVKKMFDFLDGKVHIHSSADTIQYEGSVEQYTLGGYIYQSDIEYGFQRLVEDLTMAYYRNNGGEVANNTYEFLDYLRNIV